MSHKIRNTIVFECPHSVDESAEFSMQEDGSMLIAIANPYAGDSVSGIGRECEIVLEKENVRKLMLFLKEATHD